MKTSKIIFLLISFQFLISCISIEKDTEIAGIVTWDYWKAHAGWHDYEAGNFNIDYNKLDIFKQKLSENNYSFIVFATSFCTDCEEEIPKIFKVFLEAEVKPENITLVGLDKNNSEPSGTYEKFKVKSVPSLIVFMGKTEIGRINGSFKDIIDNLIEIMEGK